MNVTVLDTPARAEALVPEWRQLLTYASQPELVLTPTWLLSWWRVFGDGGRRLRLVTFTENGRLVGLAPLLARRTMYRRAVPFRRLELMGTGEAEADEICSDYVGILAARGHETRVAEALVGAVCKGDVGGWDELILATMNGEDAVARRVEHDLKLRGARVDTTSAGACLHIPLPATWSEYLNKLDSARRYVVARSLRDLEKWAGPGGYELHRARNASELSTGRTILLALHGERWSDKGHTGVFASPRFQQFHDAILPTLLSGVDGSLDLLWLTVKREPVAVLYNIVFANKVYFYQSGRKVDVPKGVRPGIAIHALALQRSIEAGHREYDFLNGTSQYKRQLALESRPLVTVRAIAPTMRARALEMTRLGAEAAVARLRRLRQPAKGAETPAGEVVPLDDRSRPNRMPAA